MKLIALFSIIVSCHASAGDPSLKALEDPTERVKYAERYRILVDLDGDGINDMLLSGSPDEFGTMGGPWNVYLNREGDYIEVGEIWAHPMAIAFEPDQGRIHNDPKLHRFARIWVYLKSSGSAGTLGYYRVGRESVDKMSGIEIHPGDGGTTLGNALYEATFKNSVIPFTMQHSKTDEDGNVTWNIINR